ncbi:plasmid stabilization protein [Rhizobium tumorigenes]|uniref:Plasmid stabilization protein n=1 Tax=Rhizobium tumorigenes TaxID=2041385 RepID=A0AAF1K4H8_9HYPH|nr:plasmid stabilization protein [Rhizobium tumorigenes]WFR95632.1 plasmid stabilization protein [Rhizobium tumorigenes]
MERDIAARAERNGTSVSDEAKGLLGKAMLSSVQPSDKPARSAWDVLRPILVDETDEFADMMEEIEAERKKDFGLPAENEE